MSMTSLPKERRVRITETSSGSEAMMARSIYGSQSRFLLTINLEIEFWGMTVVDRSKTLIAHFQRMQGFLTTDVGKKLVKNQLTADETHFVKEFHGKCVMPENSVSLLMPPRAKNSTIDLDDVIDLDSEDSGTGASKQSGHNRDSAEVSETIQRSSPSVVEEGGSELSQGLVQGRNEDRGVSFSDVALRAGRRGKTDIGEVKKVCEGWRFLDASGATSSHESMMPDKITSIRATFSYLKKSEDRKDVINRIYEGDSIYSVYYQSLMRKLEALTRGSSLNEHRTFQSEVRKFTSRCRDKKGLLPIGGNTEIFDGVDMKVCEQLSFLKLFLKASEASIASSHYSKIIRMVSMRSRNDPSYVKEILTVLSRVRGDKKLSLSVEGDRLEFKSEKYGESTFKGRYEIFDKYRILNKNRIRHERVAVLIKAVMDGEVMFKDFLVS